MFRPSHNGRPWPYLYDGSDPYYLGFAVEGFFRNGGTQAFVVRVGTAAQSRDYVREPEAKGRVRRTAVAEGIAGDAVSAALERARRWPWRPARRRSPICGRTWSK